MGLQTQALKEVSIFSPECANRVMVGMGIRTQKEHSHIGVTGSLDLPAGKHPCAVGIH
jgi:hypothetical protein